MNQRRLPAFLFLSVLSSGCQDLLINKPDRDVYRLIEERQKAAIGQATDVDIGSESGHIPRPGSIYSFVPHPVPNLVPDAFHPPAQSEDQGGRLPTSLEPAPAATEMSPSIYSPSEREQVQLLGFRDVLVYADRHGRDLQDAKEDLYLAALDLTLERHLWTPQFVASIQTDFADFGQVSDFDRAMTAVSNVSVSQRLPYGGEVTARVINTLMRDLGAHTTSGESGNVILEGNLPLFRGAGRVAYESRYQAERELIYAVRTYEHFRRDFLVQVSSQYFDLQQLKAAIANAFQSYKSRKDDYEKAEFMDRVQRSRTVFDAPRAKSSFRQAEVTLVSAKENYASALDRFAILIGMAVGTTLDVVSQEEDQESLAVERLLTDADDSLSVQTGLKYRLDLLNTLDAIDDAKRGVVIAKNAILPDLNLNGSVTLDTDAEQLNSVSYNTERATWRGGIALTMNDRKAERNAYRKSLIDLRRAERGHDQFQDEVRADVRRSLRRIAQQENLRLIQQLNVEENIVRAQAARAQFDLGKSTNQDVVDADNDLLQARNNLADAVARYRIAILQFRRDTGTLRVNDAGQIRND